MGEYDALTEAERARLEAFARRFEQLDASAYVTLAETGGSPAIDAAQARALGLIEDRARHAAVRAAVASFVDEGSRAYSRRMSLTDTLMLFQSLPDRAEDRVRFLRSLERAVVAVILADELPEDDRDALLGPWAAVVA